MQLTNYLHLLCRETYLVDAIFSDNNIKITSFLKYFKYLQVAVRRYSNESYGAVVTGLSLFLHQPICGILPKDGPEALGVLRA